MANPQAEGRFEGNLQNPLKIYRNSIFLPIAVAGGGKLARFVLVGIDSLGLGRRIIGPMRRFREGFGRV